LAERALVAALELHLLEHHRHVFVGHVGADKPAHHLADQRGARRRRELRPAVAVFADRVEGELADLTFRLLRHEALHFVQEQALWPQLAADPRRIARDVHEREHERRDAHVFERRGDRGVVFGDRQPGVGVAFAHDSTRIVPRRAD